MDINFELYKIFYQVARTGSFSEAAEKLFISQSAVSQSVKHLEEKIGGKLFSRKTRRVQLTCEGETLFRHVEQAYHVIKAGEEKLLEVRNLDAGEIRLGASDTTCRYFLIPYLQTFHRQFPGIRIRMINRTSAQLTHILKNGQIDVGIVTLPVADRRLHTEVFMEVEDIFVASESFSRFKGRKAAFAELASHPLLLLQKDSATRRHIDSFFQRKGLTIAPEIELESVDLLVEFAKMGLGIAHVLKESAAGAIARRELFQLATEEKLPARSLGIVTATDVPLSPASLEFIKCLKAVNI